MQDIIISKENGFAGRISKKLQQAILLIVNHGYSVNKAAESTNYSTYGLAQALRREHVQQYKRDITQAFMANSTDLARFTLVELCRNSKSDDVRHKAARTLLELSGEIGKTADNSINMGDVQFIFTHKPPDKLIDNQLTIDVNPQVIHVVTPDALADDTD